MFTGIVTYMGTLKRVELRDGASLYEIGTDMPMADVAIGASMACAGVCLTVVDKGDASFMVEVSNETLDKTTLPSWEEGTKINLEPALKFGDELGGHLVSGHVDGVGTLERDIVDGASHRLIFAVPEGLAPMIATKGSVCIDGISLTVNMVDRARFSVNIIPHTREVTTLGMLKVGGHVNVEIDLLARYIHREMEFMREQGVDGGSDMDAL